MIEVLKNPRLRLEQQCDEIVLLNQTTRHMDAVLDGMLYFADKLTEAGQKHDYTKIEKFPDFRAALQVGDIKNSEWYKYHISEERHHLISKSPKDVNLLDILEYISDCVMAGYARSGEVYDLELSSNLLQRALKNTVEMLKKEIVVKEVADDSST